MNPRWMRHKQYPTLLLAAVLLVMALVMILTNPSMLTDGLAFLIIVDGVLLVACWGICELVARNRNRAS
jgi:hypothetical protein